MIKKCILCFALFGAVVTAVRAQVITAFGGDAESFGSWTYYQGTSVLEGSGSPGDVLFGFSAASNLVGATGLALYADAAPGPAGSFQFVLEDGGGNSAWTEFFWEDFAGGALVTSEFALIDDGFDFSDITGWSLLNGGMGDDIHVTLGTLSAVPESSALMLASVGLGFVLWRRPRR